jgi:tetrapyrrole methylase family protein/MazG family protein
MSESAHPKAGDKFAALVGIMARLRGPDGCPWDREQDHRSLRGCLLEETYELLEAIDQDDPEAVRQELGDVLLQVIFHAQLAAEAGHFDIGDVIEGLREKLIARHPHVFGDSCVETAEAVLEQWERLKREERGQSPGEQAADIARTLPALARAQTAQRQAARAGGARSWNESHAALKKAVKRLEAESEGGGGLEEAAADLLFAAAELAGGRGVDAEQALREGVERFAGQFRWERGEKKAGAG